MTAEMKMKLFEKMFELERLGSVQTYDGRDYFEQSNGAYEMLRILGLDLDYIKWSCDK